MPQNVDVTSKMFVIYNEQTNTVQEAFEARSTPGAHFIERQVYSGLKVYGFDRGSNVPRVLTQLYDHSLHKFYPPSGKSWTRMTAQEFKDATSPSADN